MFLLEKQGRGLSVQNIRICISAIFAEAVEREILSVNPAHNLGRVFKMSKPRKQTNFLTKEQVALLLKQAKEDTPYYYDFLLTAFLTGMRLGHSSISTTVDLYGHAIPGTNRMAVNKLDDGICIS